MRLRVATWNVWWRFGDPDRRRDAIVAVLRELDADVVALQEVWWHGEGSFADDLAAELGMQVALRPSRDPASWVSSLPGAEAYGIGNAVLARGTLGEPVVAPLPAPPREGATRMVLDVVVDTPAGSCRVVTVHLTSTPSSRLRCEQVRALAAHVAAAPSTDLPPVVLGDFNAEPDSDEMRMLEGLLTEPAAPGLLLANVRRWALDPAEATFTPANPHVVATAAPPVRIDHVLVGLGRGTVPVRIARSAVFGAAPVAGVWPSDHAGVVTDLDVGPP
ncbi:endonuclease/exonuclease/phosphatase family protein [Actinomycetospora chiangmaiensis]|uniref:endonuclease/exonuclease/phosphatase family protein n=1 Tax=Actinomycetospora chiangmaiensis TaxID=402650 RepID=UPI0003706043|nr:endonuclease/exonuclease/phosphatase family protein [Actinomycetospora chiangmaiensis]